MDRHGRKWAGSVALVLSSVGLSFLALASSQRACLVAAVALGLGNGMSNGWIQTVGADLAPEGGRAQFLGMWNLLMGVGTSLGPLLCGAAAQWVDVDFSCLVAAGVTATGGVWYLLVGVETLVVTKGDAVSGGKGKKGKEMV